MRFTMPLALDLISALVMGSTLPVATTLLAKGPCSTLAFLSSGILAPPRLAPMMMSTMTTTATMAAMMKSFFFLLLPLPFATTASEDIQKQYGLVKVRANQLGSSFHFRGFSLH